MKMEFTAFARKLQGTGASRRLRGGGKVPGIVYGADKAATPIELDHHALSRHLKMEAFHASILDMTLDGEKQQVLLRDVQMHPFRQLVLHVDFQRVDKNRKIHMKVPLHFVNAEVSPGVKEQGGIPNHVLNELDVTCLPDDLPGFIEVDMGHLTIGHSVHVRELNLPKGVEPVLHKGENPVVATIIQPVLITEEETAAAEAVPAAEVPTTEQAQPDAAAEAAGDKAAKAAGKPAEKAAEKKEKK